MQSYSATITCFIVTTYIPHGLFNSKLLHILQQNTYKMLFCELQTHFSQDLLFLGCDIFPQVMVIC